jgi:hypothetical protein
MARARTQKGPLSSTTEVLVACSLENPVIIEGNQYNAGMGNKVSSAGDVNGDGYSDVLIVPICLTVGYRKTTE